MSDLPTSPTSEVPQRDTDPHELKPSLPPSLPPNSVSFADVLLAYQAMAGEIQGFRVEQAILRDEQAILRTAINDLSAQLTEHKKYLVEQPSWVTNFLDKATGIVSRTEVLEARFNQQVRFCHAAHDNGHEHLVIPPNEIG